MIVMLITDKDDGERALLRSIAKDKAAMYTDDKWYYIECHSVSDFEQCVDSKTRFDMACVDVTMPSAMDYLPKLREVCPLIYLILIADTSVSPLVYMKPSIHAESLLLKPLGNSNTASVLDEAVSVFASRMETPDEKQVFVARGRNGKKLFPYGEINYFEARDKRVYLCTETGEYGFADTIDHLEQELSDLFLRVHRSFLVNKKKIAEVYLSHNSIVLNDGSEVPLSRSYKAAVKAFLKGDEHHEGNRNENLDPVL